MQCWTGCWGKCSNIDFLRWLCCHSSCWLSLPLLHDHANSETYSHPLLLVLKKLSASYSDPLCMKGLNSKSEDKNISCSTVYNVLKIVLTLHIKTEIKPNLSALCEQYISFQIWLPINPGKSTFTAVIRGPSLLLSYSSLTASFTSCSSFYAIWIPNLMTHWVKEWITAVGSVGNRVWQFRSSCGTHVHCMSASWWYHVSQSKIKSQWLMEALFIIAIYCFRKTLWELKFCIASFE